jgi:hypothetical protein
MFSCLLCVFLVSNLENVTLTPEAYPIETNRAPVNQGQAFYFNDFEHYDVNRPPWGGQRFTLWTVLRTDSAHSGEKVLLGNSTVRDEEAYVVSEEFSVPEEVEHLSIKIQARFVGGHNTWQVVPQGPVLIMARFIVNPDNSISVIDADSPDEPVQTWGQVNPIFGNGAWETLEFKLNRRTIRYHIIWKGELIHSGTPFTTNINSIALVQTTRSSNVNMRIDTIEVTEDLEAVPTLSQWGLVLFCAVLISAALLQRRRG